LMKAHVSVVIARGDTMNRFRRSPVRWLMKQSYAFLSNDHGGWQITFSAFILILLAFFIMLSSFATIEQSRITSFVRSFSTAVSILSGGLKFGENDDILPYSPDIVKNFDVLPTLKNVTKGLNLEHEVSFEVTPRGLVMRLSERLLFSSGVAELSTDAFPLLDSIGDIIKRSELPIHIEGHTDDVPIATSKFPSNWELSTARAVTVLRYFIEEKNIPAQRLSAVGYGEFQPLVPNESSALRAKNRRVEIVFVGDAENFLNEDSEDATEADVQ